MLRTNQRRVVEEAVAAGAVPFNAPGGARVGLFIRPPGRNRRTALMGEDGVLNAAGRYYYRLRGEEPAQNRRFSARPPRIEGRREIGYLTDGTTALLKTFRPGKGWVFTEAGRHYYATRRVEMIVSFPTRQRYHHERTRAPTWGEPERLPSTATEMGIVSVPGSFSDDEKDAEARRRAVEFVEGARATDPDSGRKIIASDAYSDWVLEPGWEGALEVSEQETAITAEGQAAIETVLDRPLRTSRPWVYSDCLHPEAMCKEAFEETNGRCVAHQLPLVCLKDGQPMWTEGEVEELLERASAAVYGDAPPEDGWDWRAEGPTARMVAWICEQRGIAVNVLWRRRKIYAFTPERPNKHLSPLCFQIQGDHLYAYDDPTRKTIISKMALWDAKTSNSDRVEIQRRDREAGPPEEQWRALPADLSMLEAGVTYRYEGSLAELRRRFFERRVVPKVFLAGPEKMKALGVAAGRGVATIRPSPADAVACRKFCQLFSERTGQQLEYMGQSKEVLCHRAFELLCAPPQRRRAPSEAVAALRESQSSRCALCGDALKAHHVDHVVPLKSRGGNEAANLQLLCPECHIGKSASESAADVEDDNPFLSRLNAETWRQFHLAPKPPQVVADLRPAPPGREITNVDVIGCRFNGFRNLPYDVPVYSALDDVRERRGHELGDFNWIGEVGCRCPLLALPYWGAGWYSRMSCEYLLCQGTIKWSHVELVWFASARVSVKYLADRLECLRDLWLEADAPLGKVAPLAMFGLWSKQRRYVYSLETVSEPQDAGAGATHKKRLQDGIWDVFYRSEVLTYGSLRPLHQLCLEQERLQLARAVRAMLQEVPPHKIVTLRVDGVYADLGKHGPKLREKIAALTYKDLPGLGHRKGLRGSWGPGVVERGSEREEPVYRVAVAPAPPPTGADNLRIEHAERPPMESDVWTEVLIERAGEDFCESVLVPRVLSGGSFACLCGPGRGKTEVLKRIRRALEEAGETVHVAAFTHIAAQRAGGMTTHAFVHRFVLHGVAKGVLLLDEVSMLSASLATAIEHARLGGLRVVAFGDFRQLPPVLPTWRGKRVQNTLERARLLKLWAGGCRVELTRDWRTDEPLFAAWWRSIPDGGPEMKEEALRRFPVKPGDADWNLCLSHALRLRINAAAQAKLAANAREGVWIEAARRDSGDDHGNAPQSYRAVVGTPLVGAVTGKGIVNGAFLTIVSFKGSHIELEDQELGGRCWLAAGELGERTRLRHAITINGAQGRTLRGRVRIHEVRSHNFSLTHLYVAASRCTSAALLELC